MKLRSSNQGRFGGIMYLRSIVTILLALAIVSCSSSDQGNPIGEPAAAPLDLPTEDGSGSLPGADQAPGAASLNAARGVGKGPGACDGIARETAVSQHSRRKTGDSIRLRR